MKTAPTRVLVVDDSALYRQSILNVLREVAEANVVGVAKNGVEALEKIEDLDPDVLTLDVDKVTLSAGLSIGFYGVTIDVLYAHVFGIPTSVDPQGAQLFALSPVRADPNNPIAQTAINGGDYTLQANVIGLGLSYKFQ